jgi:phage terminase small subunit
VEQSDESMKPEPKDRLTPKQRRFIEAYTGNATEAARLAGYQGNDDVLGVTGFDLLRIPKIAQAIAEREERAITGLIATREERQAFWTQVMNDSTSEMKDRLKAAELLGKSQADFIDRHEHSGPDGKAIALTTAPDAQIKAEIEALLAKATEPQAESVPNEEQAPDVGSEQPE